MWGMRGGWGTDTGRRGGRRRARGQAFRPSPVRMQAPADVPAEAPPREPVCAPSRAPCVAAGGEPQEGRDGPPPGPHAGADREVLQDAGRQPGGAGWGGAGRPLAHRPRTHYCIGSQPGRTRPFGGCSAPRAACSWPTALPSASAPRPPPPQSRRTRTRHARGHSGAPPRESPRRTQTRAGGSTRVEGLGSGRGLGPAGWAGYDRSRRGTIRAKEPCVRRAPRTPACKPDLTPGPWLLVRREASGQEDVEGSDGEVGRAGRGGAQASSCWRHPPLCLRPEHSRPL